MRVYPAALLVDGETHILKRPGNMPQPLCGVVLNREEDDLTTRLPLDEITCPACLAANA